MNTSQEMRVVRLHTFGGPEVLHVEQHELLSPGPGQVRVRVMAAGVNFLDTVFRSGQHNSDLYKHSLPLALGHEGTGVVEALGPDVTQAQVGDCVGWVGVMGSYATHVLVPVSELIPLPESLSFTDACALLVQGVTAHTLSRSAYPLRPGQWCLIQAIAGGVGLLLTQMAKLCGAQVIGTTSSQAKAQMALAAGADAVLLYTQQEVVPEVRRLTAGRGVDVVYDGVGRDTFASSLDSLTSRGSLICYGQASGPVPPLDITLLMDKGSLFLTRLATAHYIADRQERQWRLSDIFAWAIAGKVRPLIGRTYPLEEVQQAHQALEGRLTMGKVLLLPNA